MVDGQHDHIFHQLNNLHIYKKYREERMILFNDLKSQREELSSSLSSERSSHKTLSTTLSHLQEQTKEENDMINQLGNKKMR